MLSIGRITAGAGYEYLTRDVAKSKHEYYVGRGEAAGDWWGDGLGRLHLAGKVSETQMAALYGAAMDPETGEPLGRRFATYQDPARQAIAALDVTFSPVKSVSALWALAPESLRERIQAAHNTAVTTALTHLQDVAGITRAGVNGVRTIDADGWIVARFMHRTSRTADPQLHTHCAVLNRVYCPTDGRWRTLDSRAIYRLATGAGGTYTRVLEDQLTQLGVRWRDVDPAAPTPKREIDGIPTELLRLWSKRRTQIEDHLADLGSEPRTRKAAARAAQTATLHTRTAKTSPKASPHDRWRSEAAEAGFNPAQVLAGTIHDPGLDQSAVPLDVEAVLDQATERLEANAATWRRGDMTRAVADALPPAGRSPEQAAALVRDLTERLERSARMIRIEAPDLIDVPDDLRRRDGSSVYRPAAETRYTTPGVLAAEARIVASARRTDAALTVSAPLVETVLARGHRYGAYGEDQAAAIRTLATSGRALELLIGPAGTGKTTTIRGLADAWQATGRRVIGLTVAQTAAHVLAEETGHRAENTARWLTMHTLKPDDPRWSFGPGDLVLIDEVGMVPTGQLDQLRAQAEQAGAKLVGIGDPMQLGPVGAGGAARLIATDIGATHLHEIHRFTHPWEAEASLDLRAGNPQVADTYSAHGRLHGGTRDDATEQARQAWLTDWLAGRDTLLLSVSAADAAEMAAWCHQQLAALGRVDTSHTVHLHDGNQAGAGDLIVTRHNNRTLGVANRDVWHLEAITPTGALAVRHTSRGQSAILPADYAAEHVELGYAATIHAAQGRTTDTAHVVATMGTDREAIYVAMTRGCAANHAYLVVDDFLHDEIPGGHTSTTAALAAIIAQDDPSSLSATEVLRSTLDQAGSAATWGPIADDLATAVLTRRLLSYTAHRYNAATAAAIEADPACGALVALVHQAVTVNAHPDRLLAAACHGHLTGAHSPAQVLAARTKRVLAQLRSGDLQPGELPRPRPGWQPPAGPTERYAAEVAHLLADRAHALGQHAAVDPPDWAVRRWGPVPTDPAARQRWSEAVGAVAAYRERWSTNQSPDEIANTPPPATDSVCWAEWHALHAHLNLVLDDRRQMDSTLATDQHLAEALANLHHAQAATAPTEPSGPDPPLTPEPGPEI